MAFPAAPFFGVATAAYQVEGAVDEDGRGPSIWDTFSHTPGTTANGDTGDVACDHYHRWEQDLDLLAELGVESYRFSVAWPRIQPTGTGPANEPGLAFYRRLAEGLRDRGIEPVATLYHWDLPQALQDRGGWDARDTTERFAEYAAITGEALGDVVGAWITHNEPWVVSVIGHGLGTFAPGIADWPTTLRVAHHLLLSHGLATQALRAVTLAPVGITLNLAPATGATDSPEDARAAQLADGHQNRWFLDPVLRGAYPTDMTEHYEARLGPNAAVRDGDLATIAQPIDLLGINYYFPQTVHAAPPTAEDPLGFRPAQPTGPLTAMGWPQDAGAFRDLLTHVAREHPGLPLWVTENGAAFDDALVDGAVQDDERIAYLRDHLGAVREAIEAGAPVERYLAWSFMDNFEWAEGYAKRFGLVHVDYATQERTPKASARWYAEQVRSARA